MISVELQAVSKSFGGDVPAVAGLSLAVAAGECVAIIGPSGCGKTTTLRLVAGLETPDRGAIFFDGIDAAAVPSHRRDVAMVFQRPALYPHLTVRENLAFGLRLRGTISDAEISRNINEAADLLRLTELLARRPNELSGGQQQRVALGRALARRPSVLLLDEPLTGLDARLRLEMRRELHLLRGRLPATMIYVTHDQDEALAIGDRVAILDRGELQQVDRPAAIVERPVNRFVAEFIGWPPMSLLDGRIEAMEGVWFVGAGMKLPAPSEWATHRERPVQLGLRVHHVHLPRAASAEAVVTLDVRQVEPLGSDRLVTLGRGEWTLLARCAGSLPLRERSAVEVSLDLSGAHLFDAATGRALSHGDRAMSAEG